MFNSGSLPTSLQFFIIESRKIFKSPCIKRNAQGIVTAFCAADMAMAGIRSYIPVDEVIAAMKSVGNALPESLKETAGGGLAATPTGQRLKAQIFSEH